MNPLLKIKNIVNPNNKDKWLYQYIYKFNIILLGCVLFYISLQLL